MFPESALKAKTEALSQNVTLTIRSFDFEINLKAKLPTQCSCGIIPPILA